MIQSLEELHQLAQEKRAQQDTFTQELRVCIGSSCASLGSNELQKELNQYVTQDETKRDVPQKVWGAMVFVLLLLWFLITINTNKKRPCMKT